MKKKFLVWLLLLSMTFSLIACANKPKDAMNNDTVNNNAVKENKNLEGTTLKVVAAYGGKEIIFEEFTKETGVKVEFLDMSSGEVLARVEAEGGKPMADLWFGGGVDSFIAAKNKGLLEQHFSPEAENLPKNCKDKDGYWNGISYVLVGFMVNNDVLKEKGLDAPRTWGELLDPKYKDEILMADPGISGTNYAMVNGMLQDMGETEGWKYFETLSKNMPFYAKRGGEPPKKVAAGEAAIGIIPMSGEFIAMESQFPVKTYYPEDGIPWVPATMAIFKNAENVDAAKAFVDWALSVKGQEIIRDADPRVMMRPEVANHELMQNVPMDQFLEVDFELFGQQRDEILKVWNEKCAK